MFSYFKKKAEAKRLEKERNKKRAEYTYSVKLCGTQDTSTGAVIGNASDIENIQ